MTMPRSGASPAAVATLLAAPTPPERIHTRPAPGGGPALSYITARFVMDRLDEIGPENWQDLFEDRADGSVRCGIGILVEGEWVWKWDVGTESNIESDKGSYSDAFKRAAVKWGIGRDLYPEAGATTQAGRGTPPPPRPAASTPRPVSAPPAPGGGAQEEPDWVREQLEAENRPAGGSECPAHHVEWKHVPAGVSKTSGKPYSAFWACPERGCKEKPTVAWIAGQAA